MQPWWWLLSQRIKNEKKQQQQKNRIDPYAQDEEFERTRRQHVHSDVENLGPVSSKTPQTSSPNSPPTLHTRKAYGQKSLHPDHWPRCQCTNTDTPMIWGLALSTHSSHTPTKYIQTLRNKKISILCIYTSLSPLLLCKKILRKHLFLYSCTG